MMMVSMTMLPHRLSIAFEVYSCVFIEQCHRLVNFLERSRRAISSPQKRAITSGDESTQMRAHPDALSKTKNLDHNLKQKRSLLHLLVSSCARALFAFPSLPCGLFFKESRLILHVRVVRCHLTWNLSKNIPATTNSEQVPH
jgi:hypothetical protein